MPNASRTNRHRRNPERHGRRNLRAGRETGQGTAGQGGDDVRVADGEDQVDNRVKSLTPSEETTLAMKIVVQGHQLDFIQIPISFHHHGIVNLFAQKNNKTLAETLSSKRYASLSKEVFRQYPNFLNEKLGEFLYRLKINGDKFYLRFLNEHGDNVFCNFSIAPTSLSKSKGIYCFTVEKTIKYFGRSHDPFEKRLNHGYGHISPKNCYRDGQSTNCHLNSLVAKCFTEVDFYVYPLDDDFKIDRLEKILIGLHKPEWNVQQ
jgi:hypothetical protein